MIKSKKIKRTTFLFGWTVMVAAFFLIIPEVAYALQNTSTQVGNNDMICTADGRRYTIRAVNSSYQLQLQKYSKYITDSDVHYGCLQVYVTNPTTGKQTLQCRNYDNTNIPMRFTVKYQGRCKKSTSESKFNPDGTLNENLLNYSYLSCPVTTDNVDGIPVDEWSPKDITNQITQEYIVESNLWKVTLHNIKGVSARLVNGTKANSSANTKFVFENDIMIGDASYSKYSYGYEGSNIIGGDPILGVNGVRTYIAVTSTPQSTNASNAPASEGYVQNLYRNAVVTDNGDGSKNLVFYMSPGSEFYIQLVIDNTASLCHGTEAAHITGGVSVMVPGTVLTQSSQCQNYTAWAEGTGNDVIKSLYQSLVPECYRPNNDVDYSKINTYYEKINHATEVLNEVLTSIQNASQNSSTTTSTVASECKFSSEAGLENKPVNTESYSYVGKLSTAGYEGDFGKYWDAICTETVNVKFDPPKALSAAGAAFQYPTSITVVRECKPYVVQEPMYKTNCTYTAECWGGPANHGGEAGAGPNRDFDSCVYDCDGGSYTQNCIDSCYAEVYENENTDSIITSFNFFAENYGNNTEKAAQPIDGCTTSDLGKVWDGRTRLPLASCNYDTGNANAGGSNCTTSMCRTDHGVWYTYLDGCNANGSVSGTACYEVYTSSPRPNCIEVEQNDSNNKWYVIDENGNTTTTEYTDQYAIQRYEEEISAANEEYKRLEAAMKQFKDNESNNAVAIIDSYTNQTVGPETGYEPEIWYLHEENGTTTYLQKEEYMQQFNVNPSLGNNGGAPTSSSVHNYPYHGQGAAYQSITYNEWKVTKAYEIRLPQMYVSNVNVGDYKYGLTTQDEKAGYTNGGNKYYSHVLSDGINDVTLWKNYSRVTELKSARTITNNIKVTYSLGTWNQIQNSTIDCFYGIPDKTTPYDYDPGTCNENDICSDGIIYIWRTIDLYDMFPANETVDNSIRQPRWNWSASALDITNQRYPVNPPEVIDDIESKGDTIYGNEQELDYKIILTKENIRNIRSYNKSHGSYTDFEDMTCTYDNVKGVSVCTSNLLPAQGGTNEYMQLVDKGIAGCNNEQGEQCIDGEYTITNGVDVNE